MDTKLEWQEPQPENPKDLGAEMSVAHSLERLGWDELSIEQKIERMRAIVKEINVNSHEHWRRLEQLGHQMRHHIHGISSVLMPLDSKEPGFGVIAGSVTGEKVYF